MASLSSFSSDSSNASLSSPSSTGKTLDERACDILNLLYNDRDYLAASDLIHPSVIVQHDDSLPQTSRTAMINTSKAAAARMPELYIKIHEAVVDEGQGKVWVRSEARGLPEGFMKEKIYMMTFDDAGLLVKSDDYYRKRRSV